ncbi:MAG: ABC transporter substrate-binding protein, partial [Actinomycetota bacterium]
SITSYIQQALLDGLYTITATTEFAPELLAQEGEVVENDDGSVTVNFVLRDGLVWSDGTPFTSNDVAFTQNAIMAQDGEDEEGEPNFVYLIGDRTGFDTVTSVDVISDTEFSITWSEFFAGWKGLYDRIFPAHVFSEDPVEAAQEMNEAFPEWTLASGDVVPSTGPMIFDSWERGVQMNLVRNDMYPGSVSPDVVRQGEIASVDGVQINWVTDTDAQIAALEAGEAQMIFTQPQLQFETLVSSDSFTVASQAGPVFEHWGLNLNNTHLAKPEVREAMAFAMDKSEVMAGLYTPLFPDLPAEGLGNTYWLSNQSTYEDHAGEQGYGAGDIESAQAALESAGYAQNGDGIYEHPDDGVLSLRVGTTGGNRLREIQQELIQAQMADAGIEIVIDNVEGAAYFSEVPFSADALACAASGGAEGNCDIWDITQFAWVGGPWPGGQSASYLSDSGNNPYGFQNADFDALSDECDATIDDAERAACYNTMDTYVTTLTQDPVQGLFMLPLTQKPNFYGTTSQLAQAAVSPDANDAGPLVNVVDYVFAS